MSSCARCFGRVLSGEQDDQRRTRCEGTHLGERGVPVSVDELRFHRRHRVHERRKQGRSVDAGDACAGHAVEHQQVRVVAGSGGQG